MSGCRIGTLVRRSSPLFSLQRIAPLSSSSSADPRFPFFSDEDKEGGKVYRHALMFQRPTAVRWRRQLANSVNLIGVVDRPLRVLYDEEDGFGVYTLLRVKYPRDPNRTFKILLAMWNNIAKQCIMHLKPNDVIYVSGRLVPFSKACENDSRSLNYKVNVTDLNYVTKPTGDLDLQTPFGLESEAAGKDAAESLRDKLYLWQVFFANPYEWWDNRKTKRNPKQPDFKHKDTGEALWLNKDDPLWIQKQLELLDSRKAPQDRVDHARSHSRVSEWFYDE